MAYPYGFEQAYARAAADDRVNRLLGFDFRFTLADNDLVNVREALSMARLTASFPIRG